MPRLMHKYQREVWPTVSQLIATFEVWPAVSQLIAKFEGLPHGSARVRSGQHFSHNPIFILPVVVTKTRDGTGQRRDIPSRPAY